MAATMARKAPRAAGSGVERRQIHPNTAAAAVRETARIASGAIVRPIQSVRYAARIAEASRETADAAKASAVVVTPAILIAGILRHRQER
jgi:hypothetical protein